MDTLNIRPAQWADLQGLCAMITDLAAHHGDAATLKLDDLQRDIFSANPWVRISVAVQQTHLIGYSALCPLMQLQYGARGMDIHHFFVAQDYRRLGIGRALIKDAINRAKAAHCSYLMVGTAPENHVAKASYTACGFKATPQNPNRFHMSLTSA